LRMGFAISRKIIRSGRTRWLYQLRTLTAKESSMRHLRFVVNCALVFSSIGAFAQDSARTVQYHLVSLAGHRSHPRQGEIYDPYRTPHDREDHGGGHRRQGVLDRG